MRASIVSWFKDLFGKKGSDKPTPPPELSCFVKGLIYSIENNTNEWKEWNPTNVWDKDIWFRHSSDMVVSYWSGWVPPRASVVGHTLTPFELDVLTPVVYERLVKPILDERARKQAAIDAAKDAALAIERAPFERLGCPESK